MVLEDNVKRKKQEYIKFPFEDAPNTACIMCSHILDNQAPVLYVAHDEDDGMWQFLCGGSHKMQDAKLVSLYSAYMTDNSVSELADMPCGYYAERKSNNDKWIVGKK